jgi:hypothetical protein
MDPKWTNYWRLSIFAKSQRQAASQAPQLRFLFPRLQFLDALLILRAA